MSVFDIIALLTMITVFVGTVTIYMSLKRAYQRVAKIFSKKKEVKS